MARVLNPLLSLDAKGSVGGITYSGGRYGNVVKTKARTGVKYGKFVPTIRAMFGHLSRHWGYLTDLSRAAWATWAINHPQPNGFGGTFILTGINVYIMLNHTAWRLGDYTDVDNDPPVADLDFAIEDFVNGTPLVTGDFITEWGLINDGSSDDYIEVQRAGPFDSPGRVQVENQFKFDKSVSGVIETETTAELTVGAWYWKRGRYVGKDGQTSAWQYTQHQIETVP